MYRIIYLIKIPYVKIEEKIKRMNKKIYQKQYDLNYQNIFKFIKNFNIYFYLN